MTETEHIVGIAGLPRSGKDAVAELFMQAGYFGVSLGDIVREASRERHKDKPDPISVANMTETGNWLRTQGGNDAVLKQALERYHEAKKRQDYTGLLLLSVRAPAEVDFIRAHGGELIWVEASDEVRHARALKHLRPGEAPTSLEEFQRQEALQWQPQPNVPVAAQMNVSYSKQNATRTLVNNGDDLADLEAKTKQLIEELHP